MENKLSPYECQFNTEERKTLIADKLAQIRRDHGYSQKEVAGAIGLNQATYSTYERGRNEPTAEILVRLSYLYSCKVDDLVQRDRLHHDETSMQILKNTICDLLEKYKSGMQSMNIEFTPDQEETITKLTEILNEVIEIERDNDK